MIRFSSGSSSFSSATDLPSNFAFPQKPSHCAQCTSRPSLVPGYTGFQECNEIKSSVKHAHPFVISRPEFYLRCCLGLCGPYPRGSNADWQVGGVWAISSPTL